MRALKNEQRLNCASSKWVSRPEQGKIKLRKNGKAAQKGYPNNQVVPPEGACGTRAPAFARCTSASNDEIVAPAFIPETCPGYKVGAGVNLRAKAPFALLPKLGQTIFMIGICWRY